ncbi:MAG: hypothetical protein IPP62_09430 [bacterium]|nr:hypothetical protein [bacterium]
MHLALRDNPTVTRTLVRWRGARRALPIGLVLAAGCHTANPVTPPPPGGGTAYIYDEAEFAASVAPVFTSRGCDTLDCHGGGIRGTFALSPAGDKNFAFDFEQAVLQANGDDPAASPLLLKPLAVTAGGTAHAGHGDGGIFTTTADPDYQVILAWISAGVRE